MADFEFNLINYRIEQWVPESLRSLTLTELEGMKLRHALANAYCGVANRLEGLVYLIDELFEKHKRETDTKIVSGVFTDTVQCYNLRRKLDVLRSDGMNSLGKLYTTEIDETIQQLVKRLSVFYKPDWKEDPADVEALIKIADWLKTIIPVFADKCDRLHADHLSTLIVPGMEKLCDVYRKIIKMVAEYNESSIYNLTSFFNKSKINPGHVNIKYYRDRHPAFSTLAVNIGMVHILINFQYQLYLTYRDKEIPDETTVSVELTKTIKFEDTFDRSESLYTEEITLDKATVEQIVATYYTVHHWEAVERYKQRCLLEVSNLSQYLFI